MGKAVLFLAIAVFLGGCITDGSPTPQVVTQPVMAICLPMVAYSPADQAEFAVQAAALDPAKFKQVLRFLGDYKAMRDANRACAK